MKHRYWIPPAIILTIFSLLFSHSQITTAALLAECSGTQITGLTFRDYNANGTREQHEATEVALTIEEPGLGGIVVTVTDSDGNTTSCESSSDGSYGIDPIGSYPVRVEFTLPTDGSLDYLNPGGAGGTNVQFAPAAGTVLDASFAAPGDFCQDNPSLSTSCYVFGARSDNPTGDVLVTFPYTSYGSSAFPGTYSGAPEKIAQQAEIATTWGLAWNSQTSELYAGAHMKRFADAPPDGLGAIYTVDVDPFTGTQLTAPELFVNLNALFSAENPGGDDLHPAADMPERDQCPTATALGDCWLHEPYTWDQVGKAGLGDLDITDDMQTLYTVGLNDRHIYEIPVNNPSTATINRYPVPLDQVDCPDPAVDIRPFALAWQDDLLYVGMVCSAESTWNPTTALSDANALRAYVYSFDGGTFTQVLNMSLSPTDLPRQRPTISGDESWMGWLPVQDYETASDPNIEFHQPWLTDIEFYNGDMILGFRDRYGDLEGTQVSRADITYGGTDVFAHGEGDIYRACLDSSGAWILENNGVCGGVTGDDAGGNSGPGGGAFYNDSFVSPHGNTSMGGLAQIPGAPHVATTALNPLRTNSGGVNWMRHSDGRVRRNPDAPWAILAYELYQSAEGAATFDKANGLGDLEALCLPAPRHRWQPPLVRPQSQRHSRPVRKRHGWCKRHPHLRRRQCDDHNRKRRSVPVYK